MMLYEQQQIINKAPKLTEIDAKLVLNFMNRLISLGNVNQEKTPTNEKRAAYERLSKLVGGFPSGFDPDKELAEAREEKYGSID